MQQLFNLQLLFLQQAGGNFVVLDLNPATWYNLRVTAHNNAGFSVAEYEFATLTVTGGELTRTPILVHFKFSILCFLLFL